MPRSLATAIISVLLTSGSITAAAQERPFVYSVSTATDVSRPLARVDYELGAGERAFQSSSAYQAEQRVNVQASLGRITLLGRFGLADTGSAYQSSQAAEVLVSLVNPSKRFTLAAGGGVQHEADGVNVLLSRIVVGTASEAWTSQGNVILQKPLEGERDPVDLIITGGIARRVWRTVAIGLEGIGEDLEGFWDPAEAEGGARLLVGPSVRVGSRGGRWQFLCAGGPTLHPHSTGRSSDALRDLPPTTRRTGYAVRGSLSISFGD